MSTVSVAQALRLVVIFGKEEGGVGVVGGIVVKQVVDGSQQALRIIPGNDALASQVRLQIRHQQGASDSLTCNVAEHQADPLSAQVEEVVVIAADLVSLTAETRVFECFQSGERLREQSCLHLFCNREFMCGAALRFQLLGCRASLLLYCLRHFVEADQCESVSIDIFKPCEYSAPDRRLLSHQQRGRAGSPVLGRWLVLDAPEPRCMAKANSAPSPFAVGRHDIFGYKDNLRMLADQLVVIGVGIWSDQRQHGCAVRRRNADPALSGLKADIKGQSKTQLIKIESQAPILIAYIHIDSVH